MCLLSWSQQLILKVVVCTCSCLLCSLEVKLSQFATCKSQHTRLYMFLQTFAISRAYLIISVLASLLAASDSSAINLATSRAASYNLPSVVYDGNSFPNFSVYKFKKVKEIQPITLNSVDSIGNFLSSQKHFIRVLSLWEHDVSMTSQVTRYTIFSSASLRSSSSFLLLSSSSLLRSSSSLLFLSASSLSLLSLSLIDSLARSANPFDASLTSMLTFFDNVKALH